MIYSVWNQGARKYDYFENGDVQALANAPSPRHIRAGSLGATIDQAAWPLPASAVKVGSGEFAKGRVASRGGTSLGAFGMDTNTVAMIGLGIAALMLWSEWTGFLKRE